MRCYEAMAGGALLITGMPTELTEWGFRENEHFIGWRNEAEIPDLVDNFLHHSARRLAIARAGQERTLKDFTFQRCVEMIENAVGRDRGKLFAPARKWPAEETNLVYLELLPSLSAGWGCRGGISSIAPTGSVSQGAPYGA